ncbi:hypothetical protein PUNSTDRAFT_48109 [Punctularia strigosozonata HHB-11173 SS5]|uniref:Uncharacterized protein n=1 Tax=Punctularia strigosozonata (strain HHB-11173) TaxID=741275 RepID=R7S0Q7_PUNST|nr:uncharacterized protein PUNSTDRAFT_48109 [Punctularia strigosozonata HHB-11173 SS5]EIN03434.1 hypothetical protein PUNSTDRAFT_48109 [Punctularia strigosozonata HHB-11173 SS5]
MSRGNEKIVEHQTSHRISEAPEKNQDCGLLDPELEATVQGLPPLSLHIYRIDSPDDPGLMLFSSFKQWQINVPELKRIITSKGTPKCANPARIDPSHFKVIKGYGGSEYLGNDNKISIFFNIGVVQNSYLTGEGKRFANTDKFVHGISLAALAYEFNRQFSFMMTVTGDQDDRVRIPYEEGELDFNTRPGGPNAVTFRSSRRKHQMVVGARSVTVPTDGMPVPGVSHLVRWSAGKSSLGYTDKVPVYDGRDLEKVVLDGNDFDPNVLPLFPADVEDNMIVMVGYAINRWTKAGVEGYVDVRLSFNIVYAVVLAGNEGIETINS